jgi:hypothetical protein
MACANMSPALPKSDSISPSREFWYLTSSPMSTDIWGRVGRGRKLLLMLQIAGYSQLLHLSLSLSLSLRKNSISRNPPGEGCLFWRPGHPLGHHLQPPCTRVLDRPDPPVSGLKVVVGAVLCFCEISWCAVVSPRGRDSSLHAPPTHPQRTWAPPRDCLALLMRRVLMPNVIWATWL